MDERIAYVLGRFPVLSETFILREILDLKSLGLDITCFALAKGGDRLTQPEATPLVAGTVYRPALWSLCLPRWTTIRGFLRKPGRALSYWWRLLRRGDRAEPGWPLIATGRALSACWLAARLADREMTRVHAHFLGAPAQIGFIAARILGVPFSVSAHASDVFTRTRLSDFDREVAAGSEIVFACTKHLAECLAEEHGFPSLRIAAVYHGLRPGSIRVTREPQSPPLIAAVGRLVEKKGLPDLVSALGLLTQSNIPYHCTIIGEGPERPLLEDLIKDWGLADSIELAGAKTFDQVAEILGRATVLVVPSVVAMDGDMDGLPNVILEAAAASVPVIGTCVSAIPEFVRHEKTGLLVPPHDPPALASAIERVIGSPDLAAELARAAKQLLETDFDANVSAARIARFLRPRSPEER